MPNALTPAIFRSGLGHSVALGQHFDRNLVPGNVRVGRFEIQLTRNLIVLNCEQDFDQSRHSGGGLEVTDVRFDRTDQQRMIRPSGFRLALQRRLAFRSGRQVRCRSRGLRGRRLDSDRCWPARSASRMTFVLGFGIGRGQSAAESVVPDG